MPKLAHYSKVGTVLITESVDGDDPVSDLSPLLGSCTRPSNPSNGAYRTGDFNSVQNTLRLTCNSGYQLYNSSTATCDSDGQVSGANGTCHGKFLPSSFDSTM